MTATSQEINQKLAAHYKDKASIEANIKELETQLQKQKVQKGFAIIGFVAIVRKKHHGCPYFLAIGTYNLDNLRQLDNNEIATGGRRSVGRSGVGDCFNKAEIQQIIKGLQELINE